MVGAHAWLQMLEGIPRLARALVQHLRPTLKSAFCWRSFLQICRSDDVTGISHYILASQQQEYLLEGKSATIIPAGSMDLSALDSA